MTGTPPWATAFTEATTLSSTLSFTMTAALATMMAALATMTAALAAMTAALAAEAATLSSTLAASPLCSELVAYLFRLLCIYLRSDVHCRVRFHAEQNAPRRSLDWLTAREFGLVREDCGDVPVGGCGQVYWVVFFDKLLHLRCS